MLDDFFVRALIAGIGVALVAGPFGCLMIWRKMAYFGDTLAHSSLLGVALALLFSLNTTIVVFVVCALVALLMLLLQRHGDLSSDALLGLLSHSSLALGLVCLALMTQVRVDLQSLLFGDILAVSKSDIVTIYIGGALCLGVLARFWRALLAATVHPELAHAEGMRPQRATLVWTLMLAAVIALSMKIIGVILMTALLIIPAASARRLVHSPEHMALAAALIGVLAVVGGLNASLHWDTPSGPSIVVCASLLFVLIRLPFGRKSGRPER